MRIHTDLRIQEKAEIARRGAGHVEQGTVLFAARSRNGGRVGMARKQSGHPDPQGKGQEPDGAVAHPGGGRTAAGRLPRMAARHGGFWPEHRLPVSVGVLSLTWSKVDLNRKAILFW